MSHEALGLANTATKDSHQRGMGSRFQMASQHHSRVFCQRGLVLMGWKTRFFISLLTLRTMLWTQWNVVSHSCTLDVSYRRPCGDAKLSLPRCNHSAHLPSQPPIHIHGPAAGQGLLRTRPPRKGLQGCGLPVSGTSRGVSFSTETACVWSAF